MPQLRALFFDLDDTLYSTSEFSDKARRHSIDAMIEAGLRADPAFLLTELGEVVREFSSNHEYHFDKRGQNIVTKPQLLAIGDRFEAEIAARRAADAPFR